MILGPFNLLFYLLATAISLSVLGGGVYFVWGWYEGVFTSIWILIAGIVMLLFSFMGRPVMMFLLGRKRPANDPNVTPQAAVHRLSRPNGSELYVEQFGPDGAPTLIFTHGLSMNGSSWNYMKQLLSERYRLFVWDVPGFGRSRGPKTGQYTLEMLSDDLNAVLELSGDRSAVLVGHSMGGMITLTFCGRCKHELQTRVAGLILAQTSYTNPVKTAKFHKLLTPLQGPILVPLCYLMIGISPLLRIVNLQNYLSGMMHLQTHLTGFHGAETPEQLDFAARFGLTSSPAYSARALLAMFRYDATDVLPTISVPSLVVTGEHDLVTLPEAGAIIRESIPGAGGVMLAPSGHLGIFEQYEKLGEAIGSWAGVTTAGKQVIQRSA